MAHILDKFPLAEILCFAENDSQLQLAERRFKDKRRVVILGNDRMADLGSLERKYDFALILQRNVSQPSNYLISNDFLKYLEAGGTMIAVHEKHNAETRLFDSPLDQKLQIGAHSENANFRAQAFTKY